MKDSYFDCKHNTQSKAQNGISASNVETRQWNWEIIEIYVIPKEQLVTEYKEFSWQKNAPGQHVNVSKLGAHTPHKRISVALLRPSNPEGGGRTHLRLFSWVSHLPANCVLVDPIRSALFVNFSFSHFSWKSNFHGERLAPSMSQVCEMQQDADTGLTRWGLWPCLLTINAWEVSSSQSGSKKRPLMWTFSPSYGPLNVFQKDFAESVAVTRDQRFRKVGNLWHAQKAREMSIVFVLVFLSEIMVSLPFSTRASRTATILVILPFLDREVSVFQPKEELVGSMFVAQPIAVSISWTRIHTQNVCDCTWLYAWHRCAALSKHLIFLKSEDKEIIQLFQHLRAKYSHNLWSKPNHKREITETWRLHSSHMPCGQRCADLPQIVRINGSTCNFSSVFALCFFFRFWPWRSGELQVQQIE